MWQKVFCTLVEDPIAHIAYLMWVNELKTQNNQQFLPNKSYIWHQIKVKYQDVFLGNQCKKFHNQKSYHHFYLHISLFHCIPHFIEY